MAKTTITAAKQKPTKRDTDRLRDRIAANVRNHRQLKGLSQESLAQEADVSVSFVSMIERGNRDPSVGSIDKLAYALDVDPAELCAVPEVA